MLVVRAGGASLLRRRPDKGLLGGLWELPCLTDWLPPEGAAAQIAAWGGRTVRCEPLPAAKHIFSHVEWHMHAYLLETDAFPAPEGCAWVTPGELEQGYPVPTAFKAYRRYIEDTGI